MCIYPKFKYCLWSLVFLQVFRFRLGRAESPVVSSAAIGSFGLELDLRARLDLVTVTAFSGASSGSVLTSILGSWSLEVDTDFLAGTRCALAFMELDESNLEVDLALGSFVWAESNSFLTSPFESEELMSWRWRRSALNRTCKMRLLITIRKVKNCLPSF